jgi:DedD protein
MAISISDEELQLKKRARRRLIGAIALVTVVAVFLPMVLDHEPRPVSQDINIQIPSQNAGTFTSKIVPVVPGGADSKAEPAPVESAAAPATSPASSPAPKLAGAPKKAESANAAAAQPLANDSEAAPAKAPVAVPKTATAEAKAKPVAPPPNDTEAAPPKQAAPEAAAKPAAEAKAKPEAKVKSAKADTGTFVVQVAALTDADKAKQMREQIAAEGVKAYTEVVPTAKGNVTRVRAGPFASRAAAEKARDRLKEMGLPGNVVPK